eukprot:15482912-Alexandrium_andersonii.AAC.1
MPTSQTSGRGPGERALAPTREERGTSLRSAICICQRLMYTDQRIRDAANACNSLQRVAAGCS